MATKKCNCFPVFEGKSVEELVKKSFAALESGSGVGLDFTKLRPEEKKNNSTESMLNLYHSMCEAMRRKT